MAGIRARNLLIAATTVAHQAGSDPVRFALLLVQRFPRLRAPLARILDAAPGATADAASAWVRGDAAAAAAALEDARRIRAPRIAAEIAVALDRPDLAGRFVRAGRGSRRGAGAPGVGSRSLATSAARAAWRDGDVTAAIEAAPARSAYRATLEGERLLLEPGFVLDGGSAAEHPASARPAPESAPERTIRQGRSGQDAADERHRLMDRRNAHDERTDRSGEQPSRGGSPVAARRTGTPRLERSARPTASAETRLADAGEHRVLHLLTNSLPHTRSGYTLRTHAILTAQLDHGMRVEGLTRTGYPVTIGSLGAAGHDLVDGIRYSRTLPARLGRTAPERLRQQLDEAMRRADAFGPTVIHCTTNYANAVVAQALAARTGLPWVYEVRGMLEKTWAASRATPEARARAERSERFRLVHAREAELAATADHVVTLSNGMLEELVARGVARERITVVPNSIDASLLEGDGHERDGAGRLADGAPAIVAAAPVDETIAAASPEDAPATPAAASAAASAVRAAARAARRRLGLPIEGVWLGAASSLVDYEGFDGLIRAAARLRDGGLDARILLAGDGVSRPALEALAADAGFEPRRTAVFAGRLDRPAALEHVRALDCVVIPRRDLPVTRSVGPLKPIEAMALSRPVVMSDLPPLRELALPPTGGAGSASAAGTAERPADAPTGAASPTALLARPDDDVDLARAIRTTIEDADGGLAGRLEAGRRLAASRTWGAAAATYASVYASLREDRAR